MNLIVNPLLKPKIFTGPDNYNTICVNYLTGEVERSLTLFSQTISPTFIYQWFLDGVSIEGATSDTYQITTASPGDYTLQIEDKSATTDCESETSEVFKVIQSGTAVLISVDTTNAFNNEQNVTVVVEGYGDYWFVLDYGPILNNGGVFYNVSPGVHTVYVLDQKTKKPSCDALIIGNMRVIDYPKFFTPNGDGYHDTWNVSGLDQQLQSNIFIFDRYGKLITQIKPFSEGWDGTFNGAPLPASDYWFQIQYEELGLVKQFSAHFSLKR